MKHSELFKKVAAAKRLPHIGETEEPLQVWHEYKQIIENNIINRPRAKQREIGASELGTDCLRCLAKRLLGYERGQSAAWLPEIGTAVHAELEKTFRNADPDEKRFFTERDLYIGHLSMPDGSKMRVGGHADLYDRELCTVVDWKIVGEYTRKKVQIKGISQQYKVQINLYAAALQNEGEAVTRCAVYFLPRDAATLDAAQVYEARPDRDIAVWSFERAQTMLDCFALVKNEHGEQTLNDWIECLPKADCFQCSAYAPRPFVDASKLPAKCFDLEKNFRAEYSPAN